VDLHLDRAGSRVRATLEDQLREAVRSGRLRPGWRLPSSRSLAAELGVARNTVVEVYGQLTAEGWLVARQGSVTRVAGQVPAAPAGPALPGPGQPLRYDLRPGAPDAAAFPRSRWLAAARRALTAAPAEALADTSPLGRPELHQALTGYLARARGVRVSPDRIVICSGFTQGFGLLCQALAARGARTLAVERYGLPGLDETATAHGLRTVALPADGSGAVTARLGAADAAVLTPAHQFPLGTVLAPGRRTEAIAWASRRNAVLIEDDYDGEYRYDRQPVGAMQALAPDLVVYAGTASKSLIPGLRLGWLVLPAQLVAEVGAAKAQADRQSSTLDQLTLAEFIASGGYDRQVRRTRLAYRRRRDQLTEAVARRVPAVRVTGVAAGLHALLELPPGLDEDEVIARAARRDLALEGLRGYRVGRPAAGHPDAPALVIGYARPPEHAFGLALDRLIEVLTDALRG
jgi:GntR family transcriptional regulator/MocR family aminotransferase